jgi:hypothetical protein
MRKFTPEEKRKAHHTLQTDPLALAVYQDELKQALRDGVKGACERSVYATVIHPIPGPSAINIEAQERERLEREIDNWAADIAAEVKTIIELAMGRGVEPIEPEEKLERWDILDLHNE